MVWHKLFPFTVNEFPRDRREWKNKNSSKKQWLIAFIFWRLYDGYTIPSLPYKSCHRNNPPFGEDIIALPCRLSSISRLRWDCSCCRALDRHLYSNTILRITHVQHSIYLSLVGNSRPDSRAGYRALGYSCCCFACLLFLYGFLTSTPVKGDDGGKVKSSKDQLKWRRANLMGNWDEGIKQKRKL
jgi:hypothetical protein